MADKNKQKFLNINNPQKNLLDVILSNADNSLKCKKYAEKVIKTMLDPAYIETLDFHQRLFLIDTIKKSESVSNKFMIDFYKVNSKSENIQSILNSLLEVTSSSDQPDIIIETTNNSDKKIKEAKNIVLSLLDAKHKPQNK